MLRTGYITFGSVSFTIETLIMLKAYQSRYYHCIFIISEQIQLDGKLKRPAIHFCHDVAIADFGGVVRCYGNMINKLKNVAIVTEMHRI